MDHVGHVALTDFGLSKENVTDVHHERVIIVRYSIDWTSGRFSILSSVGWVPSLLAGVNFDEIIQIRRQ